MICNFREPGPFIARPDGVARRRSVSQCAPSVKLRWISRGPINDARTWLRTRRKRVVHGPRQLLSFPPGDRRGQSVEDVNVFVGEPERRWHRRSSSQCGRATMAPRGRRLQAFVSSPCYHRSMTTFIGPDDIIDFAKSSRQRSQDHVACFLHLRDLVYLHPEAASASAVSCVRTIEARVVAAKAARETGLAEARARGLRR